MSKWLMVALSALALVGCATGGSRALGGAEVTDLMATFKRGELRLTCGISCASSWGGSRRAAKGYYDNELWNDLANHVANVGFGSDLGYFYLARSAEGLGYRDSAEIYFKLASAERYKCRASRCDGIDVPRGTAEGLARLHQLKAAEQVSVRAPAASGGARGAGVSGGNASAGAVTQVKKYDFLNDPQVGAPVPAPQEASKEVVSPRQSNALQLKPSEEAPVRATESSVAAAHSSGEAKRGANNEVVARPLSEPLAPNSRSVFDSLGGFQLGQACVGPKFRSEKTDVSNPEDVLDKVSATRLYHRETVDGGHKLHVVCGILDKKVVRVSLHSDDLTSILRLRDVLRERMGRPADKKDDSSFKPTYLLGVKRDGMRYEGEYWSLPEGKRAVSHSLTTMPYGAKRLDQLKSSGGISIELDGFSEAEWRHLKQAGALSSKEQEAAAEERRKAAARKLLE